ncbi:hypothetical protein Tco_1296407, partial [Tanacetum coccineum]
MGKRQNHTPTGVLGSGVEISSPNGLGKRETRRRTHIWGDEDDTG